jgi:hypothetical protein
VIFPSVYIRTIEEATKILSMGNALATITDADPQRCLNFAKSIPPSYYRDVRQAVYEGMTLDQIERIFSNTFLSAAWQLNLDSRDLVRSIIGAPTVNALLTPNEFGILMEIDP